jgi:hypothetical protein
MTPQPIPLELLLISASDDLGATARAQPGRSRQTLVRRNSFGNAGRVPLHIPNVVPLRSDGKGQHSITFVHLGRKYYQMTLWASTAFNQRKWVEYITKQQEVMRERSMIFDTVTLSEGFFAGPNKVNCAAPFSESFPFFSLPVEFVVFLGCVADECVGLGKRVVYGTDDGVYVSDLQEPHKEPVKVLSLLDVSQVDVLEYHQLLIVLSGEFHSASVCYNTI